MLLNDVKIKSVLISNIRASLMPAAAVVPALIVYKSIVAVKRL